MCDKPVFSLFGAKWGDFFGALHHLRPFLVPQAWWWITLIETYEIQRLVKECWRISMEFLISSASSEPEMMGRIYIRTAHLRCMWWWWWWWWWWCWCCWWWWWWWWWWDHDAHDNDSDEPILTRSMVTSSSILSGFPFLPFTLFTHFTALRPFLWKSKVKNKKWEGKRKTYRRRLLSREACAVLERKSVNLNLFIFGALWHRLCRTVPILGRFRSLAKSNLLLGFLIFFPFDLIM